MVIPYRTYEAEERIMDIRTVLYIVQVQDLPCVLREGLGRVNTGR